MVKKLQRKCKYLIIKLLRIKDKAHSVAIGFTAGMLINFVPSFGFGPVISVGVARIFRGNTVAGFLGGISLLWAFPILFYLNLVVGNACIPFTDPNVIVDETPVLEVGLQVGKAFFIGMLVNMLLFGVATYFAIYFLITKYRKRLLSYVYKVWIPQKYEKKEKKEKKTH
ncbi:DUF2062 domain-containing protein [Caldalkalibacillus mannanilyticus]|uniref:DUF2062 domain-containing protein n=1 Tax=Caldalkalibacillus mannanilyticus TaxID=1418 RepID=UPI000469E4F8|nr:DUF2062 domain-containing protein [Caldalkalibacillus mannanilyticus]